MDNIVTSIVFEDKEVCTPVCREVDRSLLCDDRESVGVVAKCINMSGWIDSDVCRGLVVGDILGVCDGCNTTACKARLGA